jgi:hypothetical protein
VGGSNRSKVAEGDRMLRLHHLVRRDFPRHESAKQAVRIHVFIRVGREPGEECCDRT